MNGNRKAPNQYQEKGINGLRLNTLLAVRHPSTNAKGKVIPNRLTPNAARA